MHADRARLFRALAYQLPTLTLCCILLYGAVSRLTHGRHTPQFYAYQCERQPDDGSLTSMIVPAMDLTIATTLLLPGRWSRVSGAVIFVLMQSLGIAMQISAGKDWTGDTLLVSLGVLAVAGGSWL